MKQLLFIALLAGTSLFVKAQGRVLVKEKGVSLSYSYSLLNTITCEGKKYKQYKIIATLENKSGHSINWMSSSNVSYGEYTRKTDPPCKDMSACYATFSMKNPWPDESIETEVFYVLVPDDDQLPEPEYYLGRFEIIENSPK